MFNCEKHKAVKIYLLSLYLCFILVIVIFENLKTGIPLPIIILNHTIPGVWLILTNTLYLLAMPLILIILVEYFIKKKFIKNAVLIVFSLIFTLFYQFYLILLFYHLNQGYTLNLSFFWLNRFDAFITLFRIYFFNTLGLFVILPIVFIIIFYYNLRLFQKCFKLSKKNIAIIGLLLSLNAFTLIISPAELKGETIDFIKNNLLTNNELKNFYFKDYNEYLSKISKNNIEIDKPPENYFGNNIFFIHLESVSSFLVNEKVTPNLFKYKDRGIFFPQFYGNSVQTLRAQESILCGLPPSLGKTVIELDKQAYVSEISCLPKILKQLGYKPIFFKDDRLEFSRTGEFMKAIGFDEVHNQDIMQPGDPRTKWGYREDVFYQRVMEYISKNYKNEKVFAYLAVSSTNHMPFRVEDGSLIQNLPYNNISDFNYQTFRDQISNTVFAQDVYLGKLLDNYAKDYSIDSSFFIFSDHSWPIGMHPKNTHNELFAFEENFLTFLLVLPPENTAYFNRGKIIDNRYSQMDILPTFLDIFNAKSPYYLGKSFKKEMIINPAETNGNESKKNNILTIQPYSGGYLAIINYPEKYLFDIVKNKILKYNLASDPLESQPTTMDNPGDYLYLIGNIFNFQNAR